MKKTRLYFLIMITLGFLLNGCSNTQASLLTATPNTVSYQYDPAFKWGMEDATKKAQIHCAKYGKTAELINISGTTLGWSTAIFKCVKY